MIARLFVCLFAASTLKAEVDVLTRRVDNSRSGVNAHETLLTQDAVQRRFGKLWTLAADAKIMAQPLYVSNLVVTSVDAAGSAAKARCAAGCNAVIFATMKGTVYAYMADQKPSTSNDTLIWSTYLSNGSACKCSATGPQNGSKDIDMWGVDDPWWGVLSTPVIDRTNNSVFVVDWTNDQRYRLYKLDLVSGRIKGGPVLIEGRMGDETFAPMPPLKIQQRKQRAGLLLYRGLVYVAFGGDTHDTIAGWLFVYDAATLALKTVWSPTPNGRNGGIWMAGDAPSVDDSGNIYLQSGDGDLLPSRQNYGDSILKLRLENDSISVAGFFAPCNHAFLKHCDLDQGSSGVVLFDGYVVAGGKDGRLYLMRTDKMPGANPMRFSLSLASSCMSGQPECPDPPDLLQKWQASMGHIHSAPIVWKGPRTWLYVMGEGDRLKAYPFEKGRFTLASVKVGGWTQPKLNQVPVCQCEANHGMWMPGGQLSLSSNGRNDGIVWAIVPTNGDANSCRGVKGMLVAFAADDVTKELWRSQAKDAAASDTKDSFGLLSRFNPPMIAGGKVFVGTAGDAEPLRRHQGYRPAPGPKKYYLAVYGLMN
jgi:hypothetical protein